MYNQKHTIYTVDNKVYINYPLNYTEDQVQTLISELKSLFYIKDTNAFELVKFEKPVSYYVEQVVKSIQDGEQNPLDVHLSRVKMEKILKGINDNPDIQDAVMKEFEKYGERTVEYKGALLQQQESGVLLKYPQYR